MTEPVPLSSVSSQPNATQDSIATDIARTLRVVRDFPKPGIAFFDIQPILLDPLLFYRCMKTIRAMVDSSEVTVVAAIEARGFLFASLAHTEFNVPFVMIRKAGKLPGEVISLPSTKEYGKDQLCIQAKIVTPGSKVLVLDDVIATGGSVLAAMSLLQASGATVTNAAFLVEIAGLNGREVLEQHGVKVHALCKPE